MNEQQSDELLVLASIYPDSIKTIESLNHLEVIIKLELDWVEDRILDVLDWKNKELKEIQKANEIKRVDDDNSIGKNEVSRIGLESITRSIKELNVASSSSGNSRKGVVSGVNGGIIGSKKKQQQQTIRLPITYRQEPVVITLSPTGSTPILPPSLPPSSPSVPIPPPITSILSPTSPPFQSITKSIPKRIRIRYLPPLTLTAILSSSYPISSPPIFKLEDKTGWMTSKMISSLENKLNELWNEGEECLWLAIDLLNGENLIKLLELKFPLLLTQAKPINNASQQQPLSTLLLEHNRLSHSTVFKTENYACGICLEAKKGSKCVRLLNCGDVFCLPCLISYFTLLITEGLVRSVHCPSIQCVKQRSLYERSNPSVYSSTSTTTTVTSNKPGQVEKDELEEIVGKELTERWENLLEKMRIDSDLSFSRCPRESCQAAVASAGEEEKLRICGECGYSYCVFCRRGWHGTINPCSIPQSSLIVTSFLLGTKEEQLSLELKYGKSNIRRLVAVFEEDRLNREWIELNSMKCPGCKISVERIAGCSHMQCSRCQIHFCYRCGSKISALDPYLHYSTPGLSCYNKLFEGQPTPDWLNPLA